MQHAAEATSPNDDVRQYVLEVNEDRTTGEVVEILASLLEHALHPEPDYRLPVPTLLLVGDDDRIGDIVDGEPRVGGARQHVEHVVIPDAGHASNQDNPAAFTAALRRSWTAPPRGAGPAGPRARGAAPARRELIVGPRFPGSGRAGYRPDDQLG